MNLKLSLKPNSLMRVENFTKRAMQSVGSVGSVGLVVLMLALFPSIGFSQDLCTNSCISPNFPTIRSCGIAIETTLIDFDPCTYDVPTTAEGSMDSLTIDLSGQVCYDTDGNAVTPANPQTNESILWSSFSVPANSGTFGIQVDHDEDVSWAIYHSAAMTCDSSAQLTFVQCGINSTDTINVKAGGDLSMDGFYYVGVWDAANSSNAEDMVLTGNPTVTLFNNCGEDLSCNVSIDSYTITDNFDDTYFLCVDITGFNAAYTISDPAAIQTLPTYGSGMAPSYPDTLCLGNPGDDMNNVITGQLCLLYNDDTSFTGATISAVTDAGCNTAENSADCVAFINAPAAVNFTLDCDASCFDDDTATSLENLPDALDATALMACNAIDVVAGTNITISSNDIVTPTADGFLVTRLYCVTDEGSLPGTADDETECCTQEFTVMADPGDCPLSCNDLIQISLDQNCEARITPDMMLEGSGMDATCNYYLKIEDESGNEIGNPLSCDYVGQKIKVSVFSGDNSCWGEILLEDKIKPQIGDCDASISIGCNATEPFFDPVRDAMANDNCGTPLELIVIANELEDNGCDSGPVATRTITYAIRDMKGNLSETCTYTINFTQADLDCDNLDDSMGLMRPRNWNNAPGEMDELKCVDSDGDGFLDWDADGDGIPDVSYTGAPTLDGNPIYPDSEGYCKVQATFSDTRITVGSCDKNFKMLRQWTVLNWCNSDQVCQFYQIIKVVDDSPPITTSEIVDCFEVPTTNAFSCTADFPVPAPTIIFECNDYTWTVSYLPSTMVPGFDADPYDASVCLQPDDFQTEGLFIETGITRTSSDNTPITLTDLPLGQTWIRYRVTDECGNESLGASEIRVTENIPPTPVCDEHTTVTLTSQNEARVMAESFDDGSYDLCGYGVSYDVRRMDEPDSAFKDYIDFDCDDIGSGNMIVLRISDRAGLSNICMVEAAVWGRSKLAWGDLPADALNLACGADTSAETLGMATATDECGDPVVTFSDAGDLNSCGYGTLTRTFTAESADGKSTLTHTQNIEIVSPITNIVWPSEFVEHNGCGSDDDLSPDNPKFGRPSYNDSDCSMIAVTHDDQYFNFTEGACLKVVRTWTVIDWCDFNANSSNRETFVQVIKVYNEVAPAANTCGEIVDQVLVGDCEVGVTINTAFTDDCNSLEEMIVTYAVNGGTRSVGTSFEGTFGYGTHSIVWTAQDRCDNISSCTFDFTLDEDVAPTPYCLGGITTVVMDNGQVEIWAVDFDRSSFDNCPDNILDFTMRPRGSSETPTGNYVFDCFDLGINEVEIHVTDPFGNTDFCITTIKVQSNGDACDEIMDGAALISGLISTEYNEAVVDAMVMLENMSPSTQTMKATDNTGAYSFVDVPTNSDYVISADKTDDYINGVSTLDIVYIQRHILGLSFLDSPYKVIAADANGSQSVSAADLVEIRKLILGITSEFANSESWKFVDANQTFNNQYNPWPFMDQLDLNGVNSDVGNNDFVALKVADVTGDARPNQALSAEVRNNNKLDLYAVNQVFTQGEVITIPVKVSDAASILGLQTTISFNEDLLSFEGYNSDKLDLSKNNFGLHSNDRGAVTMSWNTNEQVELGNGEEVVEFTFRAIRNGQLTGNLGMTSFITSSEAYTADYEVLDVSLALLEDDGSLAEGLQLFQNKPNPFNNNSIIGFNIPKAGTVSLSVFDITGKKVVTIDDNYSKGYHEISLNKSYLNGSGLYYYQIELEGERAMKKMLLID